MIGSMNIVMLLTDGFGSLGGIAKFNRDFLEALDASVATERVYALPRLIPDPIDEPIPESVVYDRKAARISAAGALVCLGGSKPDIVICGRLNLLPAAWLIARLGCVRFV
jgi:phosphatidyl-myo-inositol dimannoside synthase